MAKTIVCDVISAEGEIFSGEVELVVAPGAQGELGIAPNHAPLLTHLVAGPVRLFENDEEGVFYVSGGIMEVQPKRVTILADMAMRAHDLDEVAAQEARKRAEEALLDQKSEMQFSTASAQLAEAAAQLRTIQALRKKMGRPS
ncbi:MAG TPA: F0F1 ATP synthase subunit epsilon [Gammaproteobacteria bacterium]|nr:F0F1 ATP synthase subunit epsilon [Gammaproteobacteria bacterium]MEC8011844.1 F0F1 ATP synthase subunit epsilon [Pseudomonadota bacterium]HBF07217.1 F0F1 ATP synthase subunit epsilon [Gammaproteobacteria bacterium]HCK93685.1 F0F1 ATP synthase subunit epsilon [Gammaproteobacteria bacterium]|tara:strand:- start:1171 stop:1599 length:429 start_codon:yes stop_codon:yes gene_type:complete